MDKVIEMREKWIDEDYPPMFGSLYDQANDYQRAKPEKFMKLEWKRASEIFSEPVIFNDINPDDISQGCLGDCYFLAVLSALAEFPERIKALFVTQEVNDAGIYLMKFHINGVEKLVMVDDYLPIRQDGSLAFAGAKEGELWVSLLEKGWAKLHQTYARIEGGLPCHAYTHLSGAPSESIHHSSIDDQSAFWKLLLRADNNKYTIIAASYGEGEKQNDLGIISGHAYTIISVHDVCI